MIKIQIEIIFKKMKNFNNMRCNTVDIKQKFEVYKGNVAQQIFFIQAYNKTLISLKISLLKIA